MTSWLRGITACRYSATAGGTALWRHGVVVARLPDQRRKRQPRHVAAQIRLQDRTQHGQDAVRRNRLQRIGKAQRLRRGASRTEHRRRVGIRPPGSVMQYRLVQVVQARVGQSPVVLAVLQVMGRGSQQDQTGEAIGLPQRGQRGHHGARGMPDQRGALQLQGLADLQQVQRIAVQAEVARLQESLRVGFPAPTLSSSTIRKSCWNASATACQAVWSVPRPCTNTIVRSAAGLPVTVTWLRAMGSIVPELCPCGQGDLAKS